MDNSTLNLIGTTVAWTATLSGLVVSANLVKTKSKSDRYFFIYVNINFISRAIVTGLVFPSFHLSAAVASLYLFGLPAENYAIGVFTSTLIWFGTTLFFAP